MKSVVKKKTHAKWNTHDAVCANEVRPIILRPSLIRSSFSLTRAPMTFDTEYITDITTRIENAKAACSNQTFAGTRAEGKMTTSNTAVDSNLFAPR